MYDPSDLMSRYRAEIHGHVVEARENGLGSREVLVNGRVVKRAWLGALLDRPILFDLRDGQGTIHAVEVRWEVRPRSLGLRYQIRVLVDGVDRAVLDPVSDVTRPGTCVNCGYALAGLAVVDGEVRCPECGRHSAAKSVGIE
jgi:hypothetical protein